MSSEPNLLQTFDQQPSSFIGRTLSRLRWAILGTMLLITLAWPLQGRTGHAIWLYIAAFASYNLLVEVTRMRIEQFHSFAWVPLLDLPVAGLLYFLDADPAGPLFVTFYVAVLTAAATMKLRGTLLYMLAVVVIVLATAPTLPLWTPTPGMFRALGSRLVVLLLVGGATAVLTRRLVLEQEQARSHRSQAERLEELDRLRSEFISTISHDLRTPLTAARAGVGMLETSALDRLRPDEQQLLLNVRRNIERLGRLIDDLLTLNQLEAGVLQLDRQPRDLREVVTDALSAVHPLLREKGQRLEVDLPEALPACADLRRLEQLIVNLLINAHRHTPPGTCIAIRGHVKGGEACLSVSDDGPGIPAEELEAIFERFHRVTTGTEGSGLGLAIAMAIAELHDGRLWAESEPGRGTTFQLALPLRDQGGDV